MAVIPTNVVEQYWNTHGFHGIITRAALRIFQFIFAIIAAALYGVDIAKWARVGAEVDSEWSVAVVLAALSAVTCIYHCFATVTHVHWSIWDAILALVWLVMTVLAAQHVFGGKELRANKSGTIEYTTPVLKAVFFIDIISMILWLVTVFEAISFCCITKRNKRKISVVASGMELSEEGRWGTSRSEEQVVRP
ncbi:hypothetical protein F5Y04DRAFT_287755 [Hypomontagnella monticulosa]|nr:hypothetical protein F5Y04DRAFT_287755 [Hypomontagnella monticulosa]